MSADRELIPDCQCDCECDSSQDWLDRVAALVLKMGFGSLWLHEIELLSMAQTHLKDSPSGAFTDPSAFRKAMTGVFDGATAAERDTYTVKRSWRDTAYYYQFERKDDDSQPS